MAFGDSLKALAKFDPSSLFPSATSSKTKNLGKSLTSYAGSNLSSFMKGSNKSGTAFLIGAVSKINPATFPAILAGKTTSGAIGSALAAVSKFNPSSVLSGKTTSGVIGSTMTAIGKFNPGSIFSGSGPNLPGPLGSPAFSIKGLSNKIGIGPQVERAFLSAKSKFLPKWLRLSFPLDNEKRKLGTIYPPTPNNIDAYDNTSVAFMGDKIQPTPNNIDAYDNKSAAYMGDKIKGSPAGDLGGIGAVESIMSRAKSFAKPSRYRVVLGSPFMPLSEYAADTSFSCSAASLPGIALSTFESRRGSPNLVKLPYDVIYEDVKMTFQVSGKMKEHDFFIQWMNWTYDPIRNTFRYADSFYSDISIMQLDESLALLKHVNLIDAYPTNVSDITLAYDSTDSIETFDVNFTYRSWETL